ncbi:MAG: magnesium transporter [Nitrospinota bacterium]|nr:magnesium transporter [Nitrospinota bacterium]
MTGSTTTVVQALNRQYLLDYPSEAIEQFEAMEPAQAGEYLAHQSIPLILTIFKRLTPDIASSIFNQLPNSIIQKLLVESNPVEMVTLLGQMKEEERERYLSLVDSSIKNDFKAMAAYPDDSAGRLMDTRFHVFRENMEVRQCLRRLRTLKYKSTRTIFLVNSENQLSSRVNMQDLALAEPLTLLSELAFPIRTVVNPTDSREEVVSKLEEFKLSNLPVVDVSGRLIGVVGYDALVKAAEEEATLDIQTMFGVSKDERALSKPGFSIRKRLPWLHINLLTAFLAAGVVGLFEGTIAKFTALAVLLPVVAGQSGNAGAQALAVTMRGLALKEISVRQWATVALKEAAVGLVNGVAIALTTAVGVYFWSHSLGLASIIAISMVLSMVIAGIAGASVPIVLTRIGQDPATASSIILTTVTDVAGFLSFLGIATLLSKFL